MASNSSLYSPSYRKYRKFVSEQPYNGTVNFSNGHTVNTFCHGLNILGSVPARGIDGAAILVDRAFGLVFLSPAETDVMMHE